MKLNIAAGVLVVLSSVASAASLPSLELFGVTLKDSTRPQLRTAFKHGGLTEVRVDDAYWIDTYDASGVMEGASKFSAGYVDKTGKFAFGEYVFSSFMDPSTVTKVARMVATKYGPPSSHRGSDSLGDVTYRWTFPGGMEITVKRGWPDTTAYLDFIDTVAKAAMDDEIRAQEGARERHKAQSQSNAF